MTLFQLLQNRFNIVRSINPLEYEELMLKMSPNQLLWVKSETTGYITCNPFYIEFQNVPPINGSCINIYQQNDKITYIIKFSSNKISFRRICYNWEQQIFRTEDSVKFFCKIIGYIPHRGGLELHPIKFKGIDNVNLSYL